MQTFLIVTKILTSIFGFIWNSFIKLINFFISLYNKHVRKRNDRINRGVTELKQSSINDMLPADSYIDNTIISGGNKALRADWIAQIVTNGYYKSFPVIILHEGNEFLHSCLDSKLTSSDIVYVEHHSPSYEPFYNYSSKEISKFILDSATSDYEIKKNASYYIEGMCDFLKIKNVKPSLNSFYKCPHLQLFDKIDDLMIKGIISDTQGQAIKSKLMMGQSEQIKLETFISDLYDQFESILCRTKTTPNSIVSSLMNNKILVIDISSNANNLLINCLINQIKYAITKGQRMLLVTDDLSSSNNELLKKLLSEKNDTCKMIACGDDMFSVCAGDDKVFGTLVGNSENVLILGHSSGATCIKWAETIGYYNKEEETQSFEKGSMRHSPFTLFPGSNTSTSKSYSIKREYIVRPELINRMSSNEFYMYRHSDNKLIHSFLR